MTLFLIGVAVGIFIGRAYSWMKYAFPESEEMIRLKITRLQAERAKARAEKALWEEREEKTRARVDASLKGRTK